MDMCPICDFPETDDLRAILDRIDDPSLIINLACDFAERVRDITPNPLNTDKWLASVRRYGADRALTGPVSYSIVAAEEALRAAWVTADTATGKAFNAAWAVWHATRTINTPTGAMAMNAAADAATASPNLSTSYDAECEWQLEHTRKLTCVCSDPTPVPLGPRSRNSLLAG